MGKHFVSEPLVPLNVAGAQALQGGHVEPQLPDAFDWKSEVLEVAAVRRTWRTVKTDRGDVYLRRHWFEFETADGRVATAYFDRAARGPVRWWLYAIEDAPAR